MKTISMWMKCAVLVAGISLAGSAEARRPPAAAPVAGVLNVNTATAEQLALLPGVGPSRARAILEYRAKQPFAKVEELRKVKGVGRGVMKRIQGHVAVAGATTLAKVPGGAPVAQPTPGTEAPKPAAHARHAPAAMR